MFYSTCRCDRGSLVCTYPECENKAGHVVKVCRTLIHACRNCEMRGHPDGKCNWRKTEGKHNALLASKNLFEEWAPHHSMAKKRFDHPYVGVFFFGKKFKKHGSPWTYQQLLDMPVEEAWDLIRAF